MKTVLVVEDQFDNREIVATYLRHMGFRVLTAENAEQGLEVARLDCPDLILMDITLPGMGGCAATRVLKTDKATAAIPVLAFTAHVFGQDFAAALEAGCDDYLMKPIPPDEVYDAVVKHIGTPTS